MSGRVEDYGSVEKLYRISQEKTDTKGQLKLSSRFEEILRTH